MSLPLSYHLQCVQAVAAEILGLGLTGITGANPLPATQIYQQVLPLDYNVTLPAVLVTLAPVSEKIESTLMASDVIGYPVGVVLAKAQNQSVALDGDADNFLYWRRQIAGHFHKRRPGTMAALLSAPLDMCSWEPGQVVVPQLWSTSNIWASAMLIRVALRKTRP